MKDEYIGWMAFEKNCTLGLDFYTGELTIRQIFSKRKQFLKKFPNCKPTKVKITIEEVTHSKKMLK